MYGVFISIIKTFLLFSGWTRVICYDWLFWFLFVIMFFQAFIAVKPEITTKGQDVMQLNCILGFVL